MSKKKTKLREIMAVVRVLIPEDSPPMSDEAILETLRAKSVIKEIKIYSIESPEKY